MSELVEQSFGALIEAVPDAIVGVDSGGRITLANRQAEALLGYSRAELIGHPVDMLVPESARTMHRQHREDYAHDPRPRPMGAGRQLPARRKDGTEFPAEISLSATRSEQGLVVWAAIRDVTERIEAQRERDRLEAQVERDRLEAQLHQSRRLESLGELAGGVAHDFNNLLAVILNYSSFVEEAVTAQEQAEAERREHWGAVREDVAQIRRAAQRAVELVRQLLAFARREVVRPQVVNLNEVVGDVHQLLQRTLGEHVELTVSLAPDLWSTRVDPGRIEQVLVNLAVNSRHAMPSGGRLAIDTANSDVDEAYAADRHDLTPGRYVRLRVSDSGTGMDQQALEHAFEPFFTTKPKGEGSGLGLATVYGIITQAGGAVRIYSELGLGTSVTAFLPATSPDTAPEAPAGVPAGPSGGETILVVEDEDAMREVTRRILARNGYTVLTAATGPEAIALAAAHPGSIDLVLTDVVMPQMLGTEVAKRLTCERPGIRALFMSGYAHPFLTSAGTLAAGFRLVEKPFSEPSLLAKVREVLDEPA